MIRPLLSHKPISLLIFLGLLLLVSIPIVRPFGMVNAQTIDQNQSCDREFSWDYGGNHWTWNLSIPTTLYNAYVAVPDSQRTQIQLSDFGFFTTTNDQYLQVIAQKFNDTSTSNGFNSQDEANFVLAFVQSIPYKTDNASTPYQVYPRFPIETLVDDVGDCKSHSILYSTLMLMLGDGVVFINPPDHLAVGILGNNLQGTYWTYNSQTYYYAETTGVGFKVGDLPDEFQGKSAFVYPIDESSQYVIDSQASYPAAPDLTYSPYTPDTTLPTSTPNSGSIPTATPNISQPKIEPVQPISLNLISDNPIPFVIIVIAIGISIAVTIKTATGVKKTKAYSQTVKNESNISQSDDPNAQENKFDETKDNSVESGKFCIYCGSGNKSFASYCEKCGKKIS
ncbi:MAG TPA: hypothetical protein VLU95_03975 [Candidatus Acidoferrum sp.]|nr:hypothetical protein [Candidatus Acidoferrum sp.]